MTLWDKGKELDSHIASFTVGNDPQLDRELVPFDCDASIAHAKMLGKISILTSDDVTQLVSGLEEIKKLHASGEFTIDLVDEDCHTAIEKWLASKYGEVGKKIHTGRSRNDQVLTALRLFEKKKLIELQSAIRELTDALKIFSEKYGSVSIPGFTHTRKAMPSSVSLWSGCFVSSMKDNLLLLESVLKLVDQSPLGTAAGYGVPLEINRAFTASEMGFGSVLENPIYAQLSRGKFEVSILHACLAVLLDLNRMASDLILFSESSYGWFVLPEEFCTGSSIMPQKKNPDVLELVRAKYHVVKGYEMQISGLSAGLVTGYHRDAQLTKEPLMKGLSDTLATVSIMTHVVKGLAVDSEKAAKAMTPELFATSEAYELVKKGMPFRDAYKEVGKKY